MPLVEVNGISLSYHDKGTGDPVLMLMGTGSSGRVWHLHQQPALVAAGYRVITVDNRGIAPSSECADGITVADMAADVAALAAHLDLPRFDLVGTSLGARIAIEVAATRPDLVGGLVLMATRSRQEALHAAFDAGELELAKAGIRLPARFHAASTALWNLSPRTLFDAGKAREWLDVLEFGTQPPSAGVIAQMAIADDPDLLAICARIAASTLVIAFADDVVTPPHLGREVADAIAGARFARVADGGHYGYLEQPAAVNALLLEFLAAR
ncbi:pimeloyl-ACP methyl ester carboxylesterase [Actinokineospora cianjurensis]|uniref:Pimeloyl-ACP methyl ester carboxylesterase n=2 Tax=Actinokineospora cianjurensis TaxID=585224 RepID=A0A421AYJ1_9PSEU|nr:alpha/beta hydrolase [Actinokineospora cianjurensis]RLK54865.1 pimeloyl-ACP methyl ester carboxylesterase [Actinokineospora cianjurensis]